MKSSILMIGTLFIMTISLSGQINFANYRIKDLKLDSINIDLWDKNHNSNNLIQPFVYSSSNLKKGRVSKNDLDLNSYGQLPQNFIFHHDFVIVSENLYGNRNIDNMPIIKPDMHGYLRIIAPDTSVIYYLLGQKPFNHWSSK